MIPDSTFQHTTCLNLTNREHGSDHHHPHARQQQAGSGRDRPVRTRRACVVCSLVKKIYLIKGRRGQGRVRAAADQDAHGTCAPTARSPSPRYSSINYVAICTTCPLIHNHDCAGAGDHPLHACRERRHNVRVGTWWRHVGGTRRAAAASQPVQDQLVH